MNFDFSDLSSLFSGKKVFVVAGLVFFVAVIAVAAVFLIPNGHKSVSINRFNHRVHRQMQTGSSFSLDISKGRKSVLLSGVSGKGKAIGSKTAGKEAKLHMQQKKVVSTSSVLGGSVPGRQMPLRQTTTEQRKGIGVLSSLTTSATSVLANSREVKPGAQPVKSQGSNLVNVQNSSLYVPPVDILTGETGEELNLDRKISVAQKEVELKRLEVQLKKLEAEEKKIDSQATFQKETQRTVAPLTQALLKRFLSGNRAADKNKEENSSAPVFQPPSNLPRLVMVQKISPGEAVAVLSDNGETFSVKKGDMVGRYYRVARIDADVSKVVLVGKRHEKKILTLTLPAQYPVKPSLFASNPGGQNQGQESIGGPVVPVTPIGPQTGPGFGTQTGQAGQVLPAVSAPH